MKVEKDKVKLHGKFCDRKVQTDPVNQMMFGMNDKDKFKRFFFAVFYTYMMMNSVMAEALPSKKK